ncbi:hypothetical protein [Aquimarina sp. RZ0]|uniref:hypothetical protein n=1 Tax=Aquimarina sp. RZ0 TaxID=2607730 RepID=UPI0011F0C1C3|nr:hypothetical protein [Aquimarina sp. RZ0]KAA1245782.1 hypothetical protein F0000_10290 [Aquimarina sp. RZ0]
MINCLPDPYYKAIGSPTTFANSNCFGVIKMYICNLLILRLYPEIQDKLEDLSHMTATCIPHSIGYINFHNPFYE